MGYLLHIFLALGIQALGEADLILGRAGAWPLIPLLFVPHALGAVARRAALAGRFSRAALIGRFVQLAPPASFLVIVLCGWVQDVRRWTGSELSVFGWPEPAVLLSLAPFLVLQLLAIDALARLQEDRPVHRRRARAFQARMFLASLLPIAVYLALASAVGASDVTRVYVERVALFNAAFVTGLFVLLALLLPTLLRNAWETAPIPPGPERELLRSVARLARFEARELLVWHTGNSMANAAIVGLVPRSRVVLFSDSLLALLDQRELAAVFAHEIGHAVRHHVGIFLAWALVFFMGGDLVVSAIGPEDDWGAGGSMLLVFGLWYLSFGWLSRRFELEADLYSLELLGDPAAMISALERVGGRLRDIAGWRHFSTSVRIAFIERAWAEHGFIPRFRRRLRRWALLGVGLAIVVLGLQARGLLASLDEDLVIADLSLGRYAAAAERAGRLADDDEGLVGLAARARSLQGDEDIVTTADLWRALGGALRRSDVPGALAYAQLGLLRGEPAFEPFLDLLDEPEDRAAALAAARVVYGGGTRSAGTLD